MKDRDKLCIGCVSDGKYIPLLTSFLKSLYNHNPDVVVYTTLVDCPDQIKTISNISPNIVIIEDDTKLSTKRVHLARYGLFVFDTIKSKGTKSVRGGLSGPRWLMSDKACYCSNIRFRVIENMLQNEFKHVVFMDVDAIVMRGLDPLRQLISKHDITIMKESRGFNDPNPIRRDRYAPPDNIDWHCGIIGVSNNEISRDFISKLKTRTENDMFNWDADQDQFNITYKEFGDTIDIHNLPKQFKDEGYRSDGYSVDSYVWCGAGEAKYSNEQYITEQNKWS